MGEKKTFLELLFEQNTKIAEAAEAKSKDTGVGPDQIRLERDAERRQKLGTLRAREHPSKRPNRTHGSAFGFTDLS